MEELSLAELSASFATMASSVGELEEKQRRRGSLLLFDFDTGDDAAQLQEQGDVAEERQPPSQVSAASKGDIKDDDSSRRQLSSQAPIQGSRKDDDASRFQPPSQAPTASIDNRKDDDASRRQLSSQAPTQGGSKNDDASRRKQEAELQRLLREKKQREKLQRKVDAELRRQREREQQQQRPQQPQRPQQCPPKPVKLKKLSRHIKKHHGGSTDPFIRSHALLEMHRKLNPLPAKTSDDLDVTNKSVKSRRALASIAVQRKWGGGATLACTIVHTRLNLLPLPPPPSVDDSFLSLPPNLFTNSDASQILSALLTEYVDENAAALAQGMDSIDEARAVAGGAIPPGMMEIVRATGEKIKRGREAVELNNHRRISNGWEVENAAANNDEPNNNDDTISLSGSILSNFGRSFFQTPPAPQIDEISTLQDRIHDLSSIARVADDENNRLKLSAETTATEISQLKDELHEISSTNRSLTDENNRLLASSAKSADEISQLKDKLHDLSSTNRSLTDDNARLEKQIGGLTSVVSEHLIENDNLRGEIESIRGDKDKEKDKHRHRNFFSRQRSRSESADR